MSSSFKMSASRDVERLERRLLLSFTPAGPEFLVNTFTSGSQRFASVAIDADGDFVVAWQSYWGALEQWDIYARRFAANGTPLGDQFRVNDAVTVNQLSPQVALDADGDFVVVWEGYGPGDHKGIWAQRFEAGGATVGSNFRVNSSNLGDDYYPHVAMHTTGSFVVGWYSSRSGNLDVFARRFNESGEPLGDEFRVPSAVGYQAGGTIAIDSQGKFIIGWNAGKDVYVRRFDGDGTPLGEEFRVNAYTADTQANPALAFDGEGNFVVSWYSYEQDGADWGVYARQYTADGEPLGEEFVVNNYTSGSEHSPSLAMEANGDFAIAWNSRGDVYMRRFRADGTPKGEEFRLNTFTTHVQGHPQVAMDADGDVVVSWHSGHQDGFGYGIFARRYELQRPDVVESSFRFETAPHELSISFNADVSASLEAGDIIVLNQTTGIILAPEDFDVVYDSATNTATFRYGVGSGVLPEGQYRAILQAGGVVDADGDSMSADHVLNFFFLNGDANRDGRVNLADFNILASNFGQSPRDFSQGDFTYDGQVNLADFNILAGRFGTALGPDGAMARDRGQRLSPSQSTTQFSHRPITRVSQPRPWLPATVDDDALEVI